MHNQYKIFGAIAQSHLLSAALQTAKNYLLHNQNKIVKQKQKYIKKVPLEFDFKSW